MEGIASYDKKIVVLIAVISIFTVLQITDMYQLKSWIGLLRIIFMNPG